MAHGRRYAGAEVGPAKASIRHVFANADGRRRHLTVDLAGDMVTVNDARIALYFGFLASVVSQAKLFNSLIPCPCFRRVHHTAVIILKTSATPRHSAQRFVRTGPSTYSYHLSLFVLPPVFHGHHWLMPAPPCSYEGSSTLPSVWTVCHVFILAHPALMGFMKALRHAPDSRHSHFCRRHYITLLPRSRHLFILSTSLPCPLFLPDS